MILNWISFSPTSVTLSEMLLMLRSSKKWLRIKGHTEDFLEDLDLPQKFLLFLDLLLGALSGSNDLRELGGDGLVIILDVFLHLKAQGLDGSLEFLLLFLLISLLPRIDQLEKTVAAGHLGLIVMNNLPDLGLKVAEDRARLVNAGAQIHNGMLLKLLFMFLVTLITDCLMFSQTKPVGFAVVRPVLQWWVVGAGVNNQVCISDEEILFGWELRKGLLPLQKEVDGVSYNLDFLLRLEIIVNQS
jgi:hypothetical protein